MGRFRPDKVGKAPVEGDEQLGDLFGQAEFADQISRLGDNVIAAMGECPAQRFDRCLRWIETELLQSSELLFKAALAGHVGKFSAF